MSVHPHTYIQMWPKGTEQYSIWQPSAISAFLQISQYFGKFCYFLYSKWSRNTCVCVCVCECVCVCMYVMDVGSTYVIDVNMIIIHANNVVQKDACPVFPF